MGGRRADVGGRPMDTFEQFFLDEHPKLVALGLAWTGNRDTGLEFAQEAMTRACRSWDRVAVLDAPGAWVRRVMINLLIDDNRRSRRLTTLRDRLERPPEVESPTPHDDRWWPAVRALPDRECAAITLHYLEDLSIADVAAILEIAPGTVKATLSHAREKLRVTLTAPEDER